MPNNSCRNANGTIRRVAWLWLLLLGAPAFSQTVPVTDNLWRLVAQEDTDHDRKITVHDRTTPFEIRDDKNTDVHAVTNVYQLSVLLQNLKQADDEHQPEISLDQLRLNENIVDRTHRLIKTVYWNALTWRIDADHVDEVVHDPKVSSKDDTIYVPGADKAAMKYFQAIAKIGAEQNRSPALKVVALPSPDKITGEFVRDLDGEHGILSLALETNADGKIAGVHDVFVEYGNVGMKFSYIATEGFGWMNASFEVGMNFLSPAQLADLRALKPPPAN